MSHFLLFAVVRRAVPGASRGLRRSHLAPAREEPANHAANLWKPLGFAVAVSGASIGGAALWQYEAVRAAALRPTRLWPQRKQGWRREAGEWWAGLTPGQRLFAPILAVNVAVCAAWRLPALQPTMLKYFCSNPAAAVRCWPMLLSTFSHHSPLHLMANMYVLHSFASGAAAALGPEQLAALYVSAGVFSSLGSYAAKALTRAPGPSLGASGAIMGLLGFVCTQFPDTKLAIIFLPMFTFSAAAALKGILLLDTAGLLLRWRLFDHAAHLGGAVFGIGWCYWGHDVWKQREPLLRRWHQLRGSAAK